MKKKPFLLGLTGSIGMGKTTTAQMFADAGVPVWDADASVHRLYAKGGAAVAPMRKLFPASIVHGAVDREALKDWIRRDKSALGKIEKVMHPLVANDRKAFITQADAPVVVLDIPLLFETGSQDSFDAVAVVSAPADVQKSRVMQRAGMTEALLKTILDNQMPDAEKRAKADYVIETKSMDKAKSRVSEILQEIYGQLQNA